MTHLPSKSTDFVSSDSDAMIQQLLIFDDGEVDIPIDPNRSLLSAIDAIASTDTILCTLQDESGRHCVRSSHDLGGSQVQVLD